MIKGVVARFEQANPGVKVKTVGGINDDKIVAAIRGGNAPDIAQSFTTDNTGSFCSSGGWIDLGPYMDRGLSTDQFPQAVRSYTEFGGKRCAMPMLADVYGLYYNKELLREGRHHRAAEDAVGADRGREEAHRRTRTGRSRSPASTRPGASTRTPSPTTRRSSTRSGRSRRHVEPRHRPGWIKLLQWQKDLVDWYGYDNLVRFTPAPATSSPPRTRSSPARSR